MPIYQPVESSHEVLAKSLETVFDDEAHFLVNLHNFIQPLALPRHPFPPKTKNRQALHEIIRVSSLFTIFMVVKIFKFMKNYDSWKMYLQAKIMTLDIFAHMLPPLPPFPLSPLSELFSRFYHQPSGDHDLEY